MEKHLRQWRHNRAFVGTIQAGYPDWIVTATFYVVLHAVDALLAYDRVSGITSHTARNAVLMKTNRYKEIYRHYRPLFELSQTVRYIPDPSNWIPFSAIEQNVFNRHLYPIERSVQKLLGKEDLQLEPIRIAPGPSTSSE